MRLPKRMSNNSRNINVRLEILIGFVLSFFPTLILAQSDSSVSFTKKEIAFFKWGVGEKETEWHSTAIRIDGNDDVYFYNGNGQVLIVSSDGASIKAMDGKKIANLWAVDGEGNIYSSVYNKRDKSSGFVITKPNGNQTEYKNFNLCYVENGIAYDCSGNAITITDIDDGPEKLPPTLLSIKGEVDFEELSDHSVIIHTEKINKHLKKINRHIDAGKIKIKFEVKNRFWPFNTNLIGIDDKGNFYFLCGYTHGPHFEDPWKEAYIMVYSTTGKKISEIKLDLDFYGQQTSDNELKLDIHGNIYQSWTSEDGLHILKWVRN